MANYFVTSGLEVLREKVKLSLEERCNCSLTTLTLTSVRVICMSAQEGQLITTLKHRGHQDLRHILCRTPTTLHSPTNASIEAVTVQRVDLIIDTCRGNGDGVDGVSSGDGSGKLMVGLLMGLLLILISFVVASLRMRNSRRKVAASESEGGVKSFDNTMYDKSHKYMPETTADMGETSFTSSVAKEGVKTHELQDLPKWPAGSNNLYERGRRHSPCRKSM